MIKRTELLKRIFVASLLFGLTLSISFLFTGCGDDDDDPGEPETLVGTYQMSQVVVTQDYKIGEITIIPAGTNVTELAAEGILDAAPCDDPANAAVDLRDTGELFLVCDGEAGELKVGTWTENANLTTLSLNLSSPPFPQALQLNVTNITRTANNITGEINPLTLPSDAIADLLPPGVEPPLAILLAVEVTFVKIG
jgi:hypothetical protein